MNHPDTVLTFIASFPSHRQRPWCAGPVPCRLMRDTAAMVARCVMLRRSGESGRKAGRSSENSEVKKTGVRKKTPPVQRRCAHGAWCASCAPSACSTAARSISERLMNADAETASLLGLASPASRPLSDSSHGRPSLAGWLLVPNGHGLRWPMYHCRLVTGPSRASRLTSQPLKDTHPALVLLTLDPAGHQRRSALGCPWHPWPATGVYRDQLTGRVPVMR